MTEEEPLHPELKRYLHPMSGGGQILHHPLIVDSFYNPRRAADINARYLSKKIEAKDAIAARRWIEYISLHERPYRIWALERCVKKGLTGKEYWPAVASVWIDSESIRQNLPKWKRIWSRDIPFRQLAMDEEERCRLAEMPGSIHVWRGSGHRRWTNGLSWTIEANKAEWFARRFIEPGQKAFVSSGLVEKADVYALFLGRDESEVVADRVKVEGIREIV